jgi:hypothetical protein
MTLKLVMFLICHEEFILQFLILLKLLSGHCLLIKTFIYPLDLMCYPFDILLCFVYFTFDLVNILFYFECLWLVFEIILFVSNLNYLVHTFLSSSLENLTILSIFAFSCFKTDMKLS